MSQDLRQPFGRFARLSVKEYRDLNAGHISVDMLEELLERCRVGWEAFRKPQKQPRVVSKEAEAIYALYPRKIGKESALRAIVKVLGKMPGDVLAERVTNYASIVSRWQKDDRSFIPHASTWFNDGRYNDDPKEWERPNMTAPSKPAAPRLEPIPEALGWIEFVKREWHPNSVLYGEAEKGEWCKLTRREQEMLSKNLSQ